MTQEKITLDFSGSVMDQSGDIYNVSATLIKYTGSMTRLIDLVSTGLKFAEGRPSGVGLQQSDINNITPKSAENITKFLDASMACHGASEPIHEGMMVHFIMRPQTTKIMHGDFG